MENDVGKGGVGILVKEELCESVVEIRKSDKMMIMCIILGKEMLWVICVSEPQSRKQDKQKNKFHDELVHKWDMKDTKELTMGIGDFNDYVGKKVDGFEGVHGGNGIGEQNLKDRMLLEFCDQKNLYVANTWFKKEKRKVTYSSGGKETEIDFVLVEKRKYKVLERCQGESLITATQVSGC